MWSGCGRGVEMGGGGLRLVVIVGDGGGVVSGGGGRGEWLGEDEVGGRNCLRGGDLSHMLDLDKWCVY